MSLLDTLKGLVGKGKDVAAQNAEKIESAVDKAGGFIDQKTGGKYSGQIDKGAEAVKKAIPEQGGAAAAPEASPAPEPAPEPAPGEKPPGEQKPPTP
ncbi:antitoxin [Nocardia sp. CC227C]|uniref:antitoxin n=1 Tax=Nocardia sp. CC227C TaxID=3044562 RepID=UPI00278BD612|nr:antitoxin [Nocardia sp. CC227C]